MATSSDALPALRRARRRARSWIRDDEHATVKLVVAVAVVGLVLRLAWLGRRVAHFDEGRVAYWAWHYGESGSFAYRYIIHGPFVQHADRWVFAVLGPSDFTMRLPVAVVGALLPLSVLLLRRHLRRSETVAVALLLALDPVLLYYSRFMRSDVLVAAFMFAAFGMVVRFYDTRLPRYLYWAAGLMALGFASKENALVYVVTWLGATGLLLAKVFVLPNGYRDAVLFVTDAPSGREIKARVIGRIRGDLALVVDTVRSFTARNEDPKWLLGAYAGHVVLAVGLFAAVSLFFYAPRGAGVAGLRHPPAPPSAGAVGFWEGVTNPALFGQMVDATVDRVVDQWSEWLDPASEKTLADYERHLGVFLKALVLASAPITAFAGLGYLLDRLGYTTPRHLVPFLFYAGFVSIWGYPLGTDIGAPWIVTHAVVPLSVPAGVALAAVFRWGLDALSADDVTGVATSALVFALVALLLGQVLVTGVYTNTTAESNELVQFAQPDQSTRTALTELDRIATAHEGGTDLIVYHGESGSNYAAKEAFVEDDRESWDDAYWDLRPTCLQWHNTLPIPWYIAAQDVEADCSNQPAGLALRARQDQPPVIVTQTYDSTVPEDRLRQAGYASREYNLRTGGYRNVFRVWIHEAYASEGWNATDRS
ncbi:flippase activity-associated protein Agl23 [Haloarcula litorea]|uniref:flippase activity-associated protein Agl23 n=1 Tax=Haloarcula litorea TaxID=3032579 RepID=UPI0023E84C7E|nr:flippase activity-associated protein Agl23 [Halomicroarcula sp. GDY20]